MAGSRMAVVMVAALGLTLIQSALAGPGFVNNVTPGIAKGSKALVLSPGKRVDGFCAKTLMYGQNCNRKLPLYSLPSTRPRTPGLSLVTTGTGLSWKAAPPGATGATGARGPAGPTGAQGPTGPPGPAGTGGSITNNSIPGTALQNNAVTTRAILDGAVTSAKIGPAAVTTPLIAAGAVTGALRAVALPTPVTTTASIAGAAGGPLLTVTFSQVELGVLSTDARKTLYLVNVNYRDGGLPSFAAGATITFLSKPGPALAPFIAETGATTINCGGWIQVNTAAAVASYLWNTAQPHNAADTNFNRVAGSCSYVSCAITASGRQC